MSAALAVEIGVTQAAVRELQAELRALRKRKLEVEKEEKAEKKRKEKEEARVVEALAEMQAESQATEDGLFWDGLFPGSLPAVEPKTPPIRGSVATQLAAEAAVT